MFSLIFFAFVVFILIAGFLAINWKRNNRKNGSAANLSNSINEVDEVRPSGSGFNELQTDDMKNRMVPTQLPRNDSADEKEINENEAGSDRPVA